MIKKAGFGGIIKRSNLGKIKRVENIHPANESLLSKIYIFTSMETKTN